MRSIAAAIILMCSSAVASANTTMTLLEFADLNGWDKEDHAAAFDVFKSTCTDVRGEHWAGLCEVASQNPNPRLFFETFFTPLLIDDGTPGLFTGYFEPELRGSLRRSARYKYPVYKLPANLDTFDVRPTRREIEQDGVFANKGLEIAWVDDPVELFFLQIQGSGRIRLPNGKMIRVGYAGANGHPYRSIGSEMVRRGILGQHQVSAQRQPGRRARHSVAQSIFCLFQGSQSRSRCQRSAWRDEPIHLDHADGGN